MAIEKMFGENAKNQNMKQAAAGARDVQGLFFLYKKTSAINASAKKRPAIRQPEHAGPNSIHIKRNESVKRNIKEIRYAKLSLLKTERKAKIRKAAAPYR